MSFLRFGKRTEEPGIGGSMTSLAVLLLIGILVILNIITHLPMFLMSLFIPVQHPLIYKFPAYAQLLPAAVKGNFVDYAIVKKSKLLDEALADLGRTSPDALEDEDQRFCFWLNSYNLLALKAITEKYPVEKIVDPRLSRMGTSKFFIGGKPCSLEEIRKLQLLPRFERTPLAAFLICNGATGSPPLLDHVITPKTLKVDEESAMHNYISRKQNVHYDEIHKAFAVSAWFMYNENLFLRYGGSHVFVNQNMPKDKQLDLTSRDVLFKTYDHSFDTYLNDTALQEPPVEIKDAIEQKTK